MDSAQKQVSGNGSPTSPPLPANSRHGNRILIVDDNPAIHQDFRKVLAGASQPHESDMLKAEAALFGGPAESPRSVVVKSFTIDSAQQGREALQLVQQAVVAGLPYALAFVDIRMPPGWDGVETATRIWQADPDIQIVICTAYSDYSWEEMTDRLGSPDNLVILKKPFDNLEVLQLAHAFTRKWELNHQARLSLDELHRMVAERTAELEAANLKLTQEFQERTLLEKQFRQAQKMEAVGQLAAGVAHDFNNILTVIHGHATMLHMRLGAEGPHVKSLGEILSSTERAANLVRQLLAFSRKQIMQFRNVDLAEVIQSLYGMIQQLVGEHILVEAQCDNAVPPIHADRGMIEQILMNLSVNARDAMPKGGRLRISLTRCHVTSDQANANPDARLGEFINLTVSDTGCGIDPQFLGRLFEPFFTTKEIGKGTGLGLATVYGIVKQHQAWIEVQSEVGKGSSFQVYFPVAEKCSAGAAGPRQERSRQTGTETVLLAEDETSLREMVTDMLSLYGYHVLAAASGPAALELWHREKHRIDLLLTDVIMPGGMMGSELATEIKRSNPNLKVIYTTGYSPGSTGLRADLHEGVNFLPKPYSPNKLAEIVRRCLDS